MVWEAGAPMIHRGCEQHLVAFLPPKSNFSPSLMLLNAVVPSATFHFFQA